MPAEMCLRATSLAVTLVPVNGRKSQPLSLLPFASIVVMAERMRGIEATRVPVLAHWYLQCLRTGAHVPQTYTHTHTHTHTHSHSLTYTHTHTHSHAHPSLSLYTYI